MKVIHIGHVPLPRDYPCGSKVLGTAYHPGRWVLNLAIAQKAHTKDTPEVVVKNPGATRDWSTEIEGVPVHFVATPNILRGKTGFLLDQRLLARAAMQLKPDVIHAHGTEEANALAALRCPVPKVLTIQGCFFIINRKLPAKFFSRQWIVERLERRSIPQFQHIITKSQYIRDEITREFPDVTSHLIPNTYDPRLEEIPFDQPRQNAIAFVGSIDPRKGLDLIADAMEILKAETGKLKAEAGDEGRESSDKRRGSGGLALPSLHIFGNHGGVGSQYEQDVLGRLQSVLGDRLVLHGLVEQVEMAKTISRCAALVAPSREEMFGNQVIEALLVGTHAIVTDETAMAENVRRFGNGTVVPQEDAPALAGAIQVACNLYSNQELRTKNQELKTSREAIISSMGPAAVAKKHAELYQSFL